MSRKFTLFAAACAITALVGFGSVAQAQSQSDMIPPGGSLPGGSTSMPSNGMNGRGTSAVPGTMRRPAAMRQHRMNSGGRRAMRREMRADRRAANNPDGAYMGGGAVYERMPDGSMRPVM